MTDLDRAELRRRRDEARSETCRKRYTAAEASVERIRQEVGFAPEDAAWFVYGYVPGFTECASRIPSEREIEIAILGRTATQAAKAVYALIGDRLRQ